MISEYINFAFLAILCGGFYSIGIVTGFLIVGWFFRKFG